jgi:hypothetical protein
MERQGKGILCSGVESRIDLNGGVFSGASFDSRRFWIRVCKRRDAKRAVHLNVQGYSQRFPAGAAGAGENNIKKKGCGGWHI